MSVLKVTVPKGAVSAFIEVFPKDMTEIIMLRYHTRLRHHNLYEQTVTTSNCQILHSANEKAFEPLSACQSFCTITVSSTYKMLNAERMID